MPVNGRDYTKLIYLNPGVAGSPDQITDSPGSLGEFSMNGSRGRANNFLLDGTDMNDGFRNDPAINEAGVFGDPATILPLDAVAELRVLSNYAGRVRPQHRRRGQHRHQERHQQPARLAARVLPHQFGRRRAQLFQYHRPVRTHSTTTSSAARWAGRSSKTRPSSSSTTKASANRARKSGTSCVPDRQRVQTARSAPMMPAIR